VQAHARANVASELVVRVFERIEGLILISCYGRRRRPPAELEEERRNWSLEAIAGDRREGEEEEGEVADPDEAVRQ
jgi:hypothetical protein